MIYFKDIPEPVEYPQHKGKILTLVDLSEFLEPEPEPEPTQDDREQLASL